MNKLAGKALNLKKLSKYRKNSVVSKEIVKSVSGNVTLFAFDKGEGLSEHTSPCDALVYIVEGRAEITISGKSRHLQEGEMIIMPKNKPHALSAAEAFKMMLVMIK
ncbi:MAG: cupin domain-containing protein [Candidatus Omnitrophica bacterium]|nr:cupin domain-containing protein [Candidatus Omnitrophota bacterium]